MAERITEFDGFNVLVRGRDAIYLANKNDAYVGRSLIMYGEYCEEEYTLLSRLSGPGAIVAEVGANLGAHTVRLAKHVGLGGRVVAFEPQPPIFQALCGTIALNGLMNVDAFPFGLDNTARTAHLPRIDYRAENNFGGLPMHDVEGAATNVMVHRMDDIWIWPRLDLLKIDVEGMELPVLQGAEETMRRFRPVVYFENDQQQNSVSLLTWMLEADYRMWWHLPRLFNPNNYFANATNVFGEVSSTNVLAIPKEKPVEIGLTEITDANQFPTVVGKG